MIEEIKRRREKSEYNFSHRNPWYTCGSSRFQCNVFYNRNTCSHVYTHLHLVWDNNRHKICDSVIYTDCQLKRFLLLLLLLHSFYFYLFYSSIPLVQLWTTQNSGRLHSAYVCIHNQMYIQMPLLSGQWTTIEPQSLFSKWLFFPLLNH